MKMNEHNEVLTATQAAALLKMHPDKVRKMTKVGELPGRKIGGEFRYYRTSLLAWLGGSTQEQKPVSASRFLPLKATYPLHANGRQATIPAAIRGDQAECGLAAKIIGFVTQLVTHFSKSPVKSDSIVKQHTPFKSVASAIPPHRNRTTTISITASSKPAKSVDFIYRLLRRCYASLSTAGEA